MTGEENWAGLLDDALHSVMSMTPNRIESAATALQERWTAAPVSLEPQLLLRVRLAHAAAIRAAQLWRGCIPQPGYSPAGPVEQTVIRAGLCVTG